MNLKNQAPPQTEIPSLLDKVQAVAETDMTRRKAVKLGVYAAYTAPVLFALLTPSKKAHADIGSPPFDPG